ncbi:hypothetical protein BC829DRAFT_110288 [Chytridium lagenaria]|nr:hypothetical protein BC829DRAFT_110288 [Chytridium lagenaria]
MNHNLSWRIHHLYVTSRHAEALALIASLTDPLNPTPSSDYGLLIKSLIYRSKGDISTSQALAQEYAKHAPADVMNLKNLAKCLMSSRKVKEAVDVYEAALKYAGKDWEIYHNMAICFCLLKEYEKAEESFRKALSIHSHESTFSALAKMLLTLLKPDQAVLVYQEGLRVNPENVDYLANLGIIHLKNNEIPQAMDHLGRALSHDPRNLKAIVGLATILQRNGDYDGALIKYRIAIHLSPESPRLWNNIGLCFSGKNKTVAALSCLKHASYLDPFNPSISSNLALCYLQAGQYASGAIFLKSSNTLNPSDDVSEWLGSVEQRLQSKG